jgi:iron(III) transport system substrate-binding protein
VTGMLSRIVALVAVSLVTLAACSGEEDALTIYSGREESLVGPLLERFSDDTGIPIDVRYADSGELALLIAEEGDDTPADVFYSQSPGAVGFLQERGLVGRLGLESLEAVPAQFRSEEGRWVGVSGRQRVLVYNEDIVDRSELPDSVYDLTDQRYAGEVAFAPTNSSFQDFVTAMRHIAGDEPARDWLEAMSENGAPTFADNSSIVAAVARGEVPMGLVNHYYNEQALAEDPSLPSRNYQFPDEDLGSLLLVTTVSVLEASDDVDRAERFVEFLLSDEAQEFFGQETFEYPLIAGIAASDEVPPLDSLEVPEFDIDDLGGDLATTARMIEESGLR